ncbi:MAG: ASKHA domain-containing protein [Clostridiales bacterium]|nr:ASKHA domain-containing protein [Clostridiales bacterium]
MPEVFIDGVCYDARQNELLSDLLRRIGKGISMPCGGRGDCGKCLVAVNGIEELACKYRIKSDITVILPKEEKIVSVTGAEESFFDTEHMALALDIGTTTLALALVSPDEKKIVRLVTATNPQRAFGADVLSRITYCMDHGVSELRSCVISAVNSMIKKLNATETETLYAAGNTAMLHMFFGIDPSGMGTAPYAPVFLNSRTVSGESLGIPSVKTVVSLPSAAAFVGADLTAGLYYVGTPPEGKYDILIDLGTNAEIILFSREGALCTAAAAGPCFEGANISCGMSASEGAVYAYGDNGCKTVGDVPARGVCGTGLVDVIAFLLKKGIIDETGYMEQSKFVIAPNVTLTQDDVRQYQLAKSAVCAALLTLLNKQDVPFSSIDKLFISGGFADKLNIDSAVATGLLPAELYEKCVPINNSSLLGTVKALYYKPDLTSITAKTEYVDLSTDPLFSDLFIERMSF